MGSTWRFLRIDSISSRDLERAVANQWGAKIENAKLQPAHSDSVVRGEIHVAPPDSGPDPPLDRFSCIGGRHARLRAAAPAVQSYDSYSRSVLGRPTRSIPVAPHKTRSGAQREKGACKTTNATIPVAREGRLRRDRYGARSSSANAASIFSRDAFFIRIRIRPRRSIHPRCEFDPTKSDRLPTPDTPRADPCELAQPRSRI